MWKILVGWLWQSSIHPLSSIDEGKRCMCRSWPGVVTPLTNNVTNNNNQRQPATATPASGVSFSHSFLFIYLFLLLQHPIKYCCNLKFCRSNNWNKRTTKVVRWGWKTEPGKMQSKGQQTKQSWTYSSSHTKN